MDQTQPPVSPQLDSYYRLARAQIEHEDDLIVQRMSWSIASQSFLFTAYAIVLNGASAPHSPPFDRTYELLQRFIPILGAATSLLIFVAIWAGIRAMANLRREFQKQAGKGMGDALPPIHGADLTRRLGLAAPVFLPLLFLLLWLILLSQTAHG
jgi:hypothetical protein